MYRSKGDAARSQHYYRLAVQEDPQMVAPHLGLAWVLEEAGEDEQAQQHYLAALELDPSNEEALARLLALCHRSGQQDRAVRLALHYDVNAKSTFSSSFSR